jgi:hypothetical protein
MAVRDTLKASGMVAQLMDKCKTVNMGTKDHPINFVEYLTNRMKANIVDMRGINGAVEAKKPIEVEGPRAEVSAALKQEAAAAGGDGTSATGQTTAAPAESGEAEPDFSKIGEEAANELLGSDDDDDHSEPEVDRD